MPPVPSTPAAPAAPPAVAVKTAPRVVQQHAKGNPAVANEAALLAMLENIDFKSDDPFSMLVYGASGTGKTTFAGSFPDEKLWVVMSGARKSGELRSLDTPHHRATIRKFEPTMTSQILPMLELVKQRKVLAPNGKPVKWVVLDHASGVQDRVLQETLNLTKLPEQKNFGMASQQIWGLVIGDVKEILGAVLDLRDVGIGNIILAQEGIFSGKDDNITPEMGVKPAIGALVSPKLAKWLHYAPDFTIQLTIRTKQTVKMPVLNGKPVPNAAPVITLHPGQVDYLARTGPHEIYCTKFRVPKGRTLPEFVIDPDYDKILKLIRGS